MGELLQHEILGSLKGSSNEWLINLLEAFNCGDINTFKATQSQWGSQPDLKVKNLDLLLTFYMPFRTMPNP